MATKKATKAAMKAAKKTTRASTAPADAPSLADAVRALLEAAARETYEPSYIHAKNAAGRRPIKLARLQVRKVAVVGRVLEVHCAGRRPCRGDRTAVITLMRDLWGDEVLRCHGPRDLAQEDEACDYLHALREVSAADARIVYAQLFPDRWMQSDERLAGLFPKPIGAWKRLDEAASEGALVKRALPLAAKGVVLERVTAIQHIDVALSGAWRHRDWDGMEVGLRTLCASLARASAPVLRECGWMLEKKTTWAQARADALTAEDRRRLRLPPRAASR